MRTWNQHQLDILHDAEHGKRDSVVIARAGTGKTTTMLEACKRFPHGCSVVYLAFNTRIKEEVQRKAPPGVDVRTMHSLGRGALYVYAKGKGKSLPEPSENKTRTNIERLWPSLFERRGERSVPRDGKASAIVGALVSAASFAKNTLATTADDIEAIVYRLDLDIGTRTDDDTYPRAVRKFCDNAIRLLDAEIQRFRVALEYNFDDMIWIPVRLGLRVKQYDRVVVDEGQDLNACQHALARSARRAGGRIILVGDDRQAIYAWRGADEDGIERFRADTGATVLRLPVTYRCGQAIVGLARTIVPDYEFAPTNAPGMVESHKPERLVEKAEPGDAILSRVNAPLVGICLDLLQRGKRARVVGRDIGRQLVALLDAAEKAGAADVPALVSWIDAWRTAEVERLEAREPPGNADPVYDRADCVIAMTEGARTIQDVRGRIVELFTDDPSQGEIVLSSTHKAKGLEWQTVWMLADTYRLGQSTEEDNLYYVAVTRAISKLVLVSKRAAEAPAPVAQPVTAPPNPEDISPLAAALLRGETVRVTGPGRDAWTRAA